MNQSIITRGILWGVGAVILLGAVPLSAADDPAPALRKKPVTQFKGAGIYGTVTSLRHGWVTVDGLVVQPIAPNRYKAELEFEPSPTFRAGGFEKGLMAGYSYRPQDLEVGDIVTVDFNRIDHKDICTSIIIHKRPGGRIPPSPNVKNDEKSAKVLGYKYHEYWNARWDAADNGIPLPADFKSKYPSPLPPLPWLPDSAKNKPAAPPAPAGRQPAKP